MQYDVCYRMKLAFFRVTIAWNSHQQCDRILKTCCCQFSRCAATGFRDPITVDWWGGGAAVVFFSCIEPIGDYHCPFTRTGPYTILIAIKTLTPINPRVVIAEPLLLPLALFGLVASLLRPPCDRYLIYPLPRYFPSQIRLETRQKWESPERKTWYFP